MRAIDGDALYEKVQHDEEMARNRVLDTESSLPYPNNLNPSYTRYVAQMDERTRLKHMIADAPTIEPERKKGKWIKKMRVNETEKYTSYDPDWYCACCGAKYDPYIARMVNFCYVCGADMRGEQE